jgi:hypothetical protein
VADDETIGVGVGADTSGLDDAERRLLGFLGRFTQTVTQATRALPPLDINTSPAEGSLADLRTKIERFVREARDISAIPFLNTAGSRQELQELIAEFPGLTAAIQHIDPTGILKQTAQQAQEATQAVLAAQQAVTSAPAAAASTTPVGAPTVAGFEAARAAALSYTQALSNVQDAAQRVAVDAATPVPFVAQPAIGAANILIERLGLVQRTAVGAREALSQPLVLPSTAASDLALLASGLQGQRTAAEEARVANQKLLETMLQQGQAARRAAGDNEAAAAALGTVTSQQGRVVEGSNSAHAGVSRLRGGLTALAVTASGTSPAIGSVVSGLLLLGAGSTVVLGVAAGIATIGFAYDHLTEKSRQAREAHEKLLDELRKRVTGPDETGPAAENAAAQKAIGDAMHERKRLQDEITAGGLDQLNVLVRQQAIEVQLRKETEARTLAGTSNAAATAALTQDTSAGTAMVRALAIQAASFGQNEFAAKRLAVAMDESLTPSQRAAATALLRTLEGYDAQKRAAEDAARAAERDGAAIRDSFAAALQVVDEAIAKLGQNRFGELIARQRKDARAGTGLGLLPAADTGISAGFDQAQASVHGVETALEKAAAASNRFFQKALRDAEDTRDANTRLADSVHEITRGLDEVLGASVSVGLIGEEAGRSIGAVLNLADALGKVAESASTGNILGAIGAGVGLIGGLLNPGPTETDRLLAENNQRLAQLSASLDRQLQSAGRTAATAAQVAGLQGLPHTFGPKGADLGINQSAFEASLAASGLTIEQWAARVQSLTGLDVLDDRGHIVAATLAQADAAFQKLNDEITHLGTSIEDQRQNQVNRDALGLSDRSRDPRVAELQRQREIELGNLSLDPAEEARIQALDLTTAQGRAAFLEEQRSLFLRAQNGQLTAEQIGGFQNAQEVANAAGAAAAALDAFGKSLASETEKISLRSRLAGQPQDAASVFDRQIMAAASVVGDSSREFQRQLLGLLPLEGDALREALLKLFDSFQAEGLDLGNLTPDELMQLFSAGADALGAFTDATAAATKSMQSVPDFFRLGEAEFAARAVGPNDGSLLPVTRFDGPLVHAETRQALPASAPALPASVTAEQRTVVNLYGSVTVVVTGKVDDPKANARAVKAEFTRSVLAQTGREDDSV